MRQRLLEKHLPRIIVGAIVIILAVTTLALSLFIVVRVRAESAAPQRTLSVSPGYSLFTDFVDVVLVIPSTTSEAEDMAEVNSIVQQIHKQGKNARVTLCSSESKMFNNANDCVAILFFRQGKSR